MNKRVQLATQRNALYTSVLEVPNSNLGRYSILSEIVVAFF
jgi:hypothetical protein